MDPSDATQLIIIFVLILLSAFFTFSEAALSTVNKLRMRSLADDEIKGAKTVIKLIEEPEKTLSAISIGKIVVNLSASSLATVMAINFGNQWIGLAIGILILFILIFGEITPNFISNIYAEKISLRLAAPVYFITKLLTPLVFVINKICKGFMLILRIDPNTKNAAITENELRTILDYSHDDGVLESEERRIITNVVDFGDSLAKDVMVPRIDMSFASVDLTYDELVQAFADEKYTRMPVYSETRDNVIGIVNLKDVFFYNGDKENFDIKEIVREPYFTYEFKKTSELLIEMRRNSISLAIVLNEYGSTAGLITIEDLLEEIVGEIRDEYDEDEEDSIQAVSEYEYLVDGNTKLDDINDVLGLHLESDDYDSIAGHIIFLLDHLPDEGETVTENNIIYTVASVDKNRIDKIKILLPHEEKKEPDTE